MLIRNNIINLYYELKDLIKFIDATIKNQKRLLELQKELPSLISFNSNKFIVFSGKVFKLKELFLVEKTKSPNGFDFG